MAFDMYLKSERVSIEHYEEDLFLLINEDNEYPKLMELWENYYNGPRINPGEANDMVHELIRLRSLIDDKSILSVVDKLLPFFSKAYKLQESINCVSD
jgi:hypothetical protein